ncbi:protein farnesyltransferase subunit alpha [Theileria orientalis]|uniref:Protein farnesyltransferase/geranylgeranyltransferase type-1 subunit alpha n=1 Tax=Theileria orientalis TaxID=68886 RepID=A0A976SIT8_THEOR|nr:protein farnesyltransferase subunit alpha [Theileria orientalis]
MSRYSRNKSFDSNYSDSSDDTEGDFCDQEKLRNECEGVSNTIICEKLNFPYPPVELDLSLLDDESVWSDLEFENTPKDNLLFELTRELLAVRVSHLFNALIKSKEYSTRGMYLSKLMIKLNPANYTAWHYRLLCVKTLELNLEEELEFARRITFESIKSYQSWNHRRQICEIAYSKFNELEFVKLEIGTSPKNQSAWAYLTWLIKTFGPTDRSDEFEFVDFLVKTDVYNNSAWNYKNFLIKHFDGDLELGFVLREFAQDFQSLFERPDNESLCSYLIDMVSHIERKHNKCINDMDIDYLESIKDKCKSIHCIDSKYKCQHSTL